MNLNLLPDKLGGISIWNDATKISVSHALCV